MTTLEQKAISVVGCRRENPQCLNCVDFDCKRELTGFKKGYAEALRWRDVNIELPDNQNIVLVKTDKNCFATAYLHGKNSGFIEYGSEAYKDFGKITHWRPIETI